MNATITNQDQLRRIKEALRETLERAAKVGARKTFDSQQEQAKQRELTFCRSHAEKLQAMIDAY